MSDDKKHLTDANQPIYKTDKITFYGVFPQKLIKNLIKTLPPIPANVSDIEIVLKNYKYPGQTHLIRLTIYYTLNGVLMESGHFINPALTHIYVCCRNTSLPIGGKRIQKYLSKLFEVRN